MLAPLACMHQGIEFCGGAGTLTLHAGGKLFARVAPYVARWSGACAHSLELPDHLELGEAKTKTKTVTGKHNLRLRRSGVGSELLQAQNEKKVRVR